MRLGWMSSGCIVAAVLCANGAIAQEVAKPAPAAEVPADKLAAAADPSLVIPALTPVMVEIVEAQGSAVSKPDSFFALRLAEPVLINGQVAIPAGALGQGEVVHAKKASASGGPGELVLAARWLDVGGRQMKLRSLHWAATGNSNIKSVNRAMVVSAMTMPVTALAGLFVTGKEITIPAGTLAQAKLAADFSLNP